MVGRFLGQDANLAFSREILVPVWGKKGFFCEKKTSLVKMFEKIVTHTSFRTLPVTQLQTECIFKNNPHMIFEITL